MTAGDQRISLVATAETTYALLPDRFPGRPSTPWVSVPTSSLLSAKGQSQLGAGDPTASLDELAALSDVRVVGHEKIRGEPTTHYTGTADPQKGLENLSASLRSQAEAAFTGVTTVPVDLWLGDDGLVRRYRTKLSTTVNGTGVDAAVTVEFFDFGKPVTIVIPPAGQVTARSSLTG